MKKTTWAIAGLAGYIVATQFYKQTVVNQAVLRTNELGGRVLNVGASGIGNIISPTTRISGIGCDIQPTWDNIDYCDISMQMPYQDKEFDVVFASHVIEHVKPHEIENALNEFVRIGNKVIIVIPPSFMPAYYLARGHQSQVRKLSGSLISVRNNPLYYNIFEDYLIQFDPNIIEVYQ